MNEKLNLLFYTFGALAFIAGVYIQNQLTINTDGQSVWNGLNIFKLCFPVLLGMIFSFPYLYQESLKRGVWSYRWILTIITGLPLIYLFLISFLWRYPKIPLQNLILSYYSPELHFLLLFIFGYLLIGSLYKK